MKHIIIALLLAFSLFSIGCTAALLVGASGTAGYYGKKSYDLEKENELLRKEKK